MGRYINPFSDWGFKRIFGQEVNKDLLIAFLNDLFEGEHVITDLTFLDKEQQRLSKARGIVIYDIYCLTDAGERIIVEMQNAAEHPYISRTLYYASVALANQGESGKNVWGYELAPVYVISVMNFVLNELPERKLRTDVVLADRDTGRIVSRKVRLIYLMLPLFHKEADECETNFERWIYVLKHMETMERIPFTEQDKVFARLGEIAEICALNPQERSKYDDSIRELRDGIALYKGAVFNTQRSIALEMLASGIPVADVARMTHLSEREVRSLLN